MKFKIGDKVKIIDGGEYTGTIVSSIDVDGMYVVDSVPLFSYDIGTRLSMYLSSYPDLDYIDNWDLYENCGWIKESAMEILTIPDTKLARRLYKNQIDKIENNKIYLK